MKRKIPSTMVSQHPDHRSGKPDELLAFEAIDTKSIVKKAKEVLKS